MNENCNYYGEFPSMFEITREMYLGKNQERFPITVRFANESYGYSVVKLHPSLLKDVTIFRSEVFATVDDLRIAIPREEYDKMIEFYEI